MGQIRFVTMKKKTFRFYVDKDCNWFQDNNPITHKGICNFNYQNLDIDEDGDFYIMEKQHYHSNYLNVDKNRAMNGT